MAQSPIAASGIHASRPDVPPPSGVPALSGIKALPIDLDYYVADHNRAVKARFNEIFQQDGAAAAASGQSPAGHARVIPRDSEFHRFRR